MKRIEFLKQVLSVFGTGFLGIHLLKRQENKALVLYEGLIAGYQYYYGPELENRFKVGEKLALKREPENQYDERAIAIYYNEKKLGFVKQAENQTLSRLLDQNKNLQAQIIEVNKEGAWWLRVRYRVNV